MEIRELTIDHYDKLLKLWGRVGLPCKPKGRDSRQAMVKHMTESPGFFIGAFESGRLVGAVIVSCDTRKGWINRLAVDPSSQGKGIGKALVLESEGRLRERGIRVISALIEKSNTVSRTLFKGCGYVEHGDVMYLSKRDSRSV